MIHNLKNFTQELISTFRCKIFVKMHNVWSVTATMMFYDTLGYVIVNMLLYRYSDFLTINAYSTSTTGHLPEYF